MDIGQAEVAPGAAEGELLVIEAEQGQDGGVQIVDMNFVFHRSGPEFIGRAVNCAPANTAAGENG